MIRLTNLLTNKNVWINPDHIVDTGIGTVNGLNGTYVSTGVDPDGMPLYVTESPEEVARKVLEWRLAMDDYRHSVGEYKMLTRNVLEELAGLEEPNHDT